MSKIRNSLGALVLPIPAGGIDSYDAYKAEYGIDLDEVFDIGSDDETIVSPKVTKALYLRMDFNSAYNNYIVPANIMKDPDSYGLIVFYPNFSISGGDLVTSGLSGLLVNHENRTIQVYEL